MLKSRHREALILAIDRWCIDMMTATVISDGNHQAISIPQEMQTERKEFIIRKVGEGGLSPVDAPWYFMLERLRIS